MKVLAESLLINGKIKTETRNLISVNTVVRVKTAFSHVQNANFKRLKAFLGINSPI